MTIRERLFGPTAQLSCLQVGRLLQSHLDGELDEARSQRVADHLDDCLRCGLEAETYEALRAALERRAPVEPDRLARLQDFGARLAAGDPELTGRLERIDPSEDPNRGNL